MNKNKFVFSKESLANQASFFHIWALNIKGGSPILDCFDLAASLFPEYYFKVYKIKDNVINGSSLNESFSDVALDLFHPKSIHFLAIGEFTGDLDTTIDRFVDFLEMKIKFDIEEDRDLELMIFLESLSSLVDAMPSSSFGDFFNMVTTGLSLPKIDDSILKEDQHSNVLSLCSKLEQNKQNVLDEISKYYPEFIVQAIKNGLQNEHIFGGLLRACAKHYRRKILYLS